MTRDEAIEYIVGLQNSVSGEHCISRAEYEDDKGQLREALAGLDVFANELDPILAKTPGWS